MYVRCDQGVATPDQMTGAYKAAVLRAGHNNIFQKALRVSFRVINIGDVCVIMTIVLAKQVYSGKVKLFNEIEPFCL